MSAALEKYLNRPGWRLLSTRVLIVEDDSFSMKLLRDLLEVLGHAVVEAHSGEDVIDLARRHGPDLIFLAVGGRGAGALAARRRLKGERDLAEIPVIALTEGAMTPDVAVLQRAGFDDRLAKPISLATFIAMLETALAGGSNADIDIGAGRQSPRLPAR